MQEYLLTLREDEEGLFVRIPPEIAERLEAAPGDRLNLAETEGGFLLSSIKPDPEKERREYEAAMNAWQDVRRRYAGTFRRLADS